MAQKCRYYESVKQKSKMTALVTKRHIHPDFDFKILANAPKTGDMTMALGAMKYITSPFPCLSVLLASVSSVSHVTTIIEHG